MRNNLKLNKTEKCGNSLLNIAVLWSAGDKNSFTQWVDYIDVNTDWTNLHQWV